MLYILVKKLQNRLAQGGCSLEIPTRARTTKHQPSGCHSETIVCLSLPVHDVGKLCNQSRGYVNLFIATGSE